MYDPLRLGIRELGVNSPPLVKKQSKQINFCKGQVKNPSRSLKNQVLFNFYLFGYNVIITLKRLKYISMYNIFQNIAISGIIIALKLRELLLIFVYKNYSCIE